MKNGDTVIHKTGGPQMIVVGSNVSMYATSWYDEATKSFSSGWFLKELIKRPSRITE